MAPIVFTLLFGLIAGCFLAYQNSALHDGATAGARMASIESPLVTSGCESDQPQSIETAVAQAAPLLTVNQDPLCVSPTSPSQLTQQNVIPGDVNITVNCLDANGNPTACSSSPASTAVTLDFITHGLVAPIGMTFHMTATSQDPAINLP